MLQNWPNTDVPNFQANVMSIYKCLSDLALRVLSVMAVGLGLVRKTKNNKSFHIFPYLCVFLLQLIIAWKLTLLKMALYVYQSIFISNFCIGHNVIERDNIFVPSYCVSHLCSNFAGLSLSLNSPHKQNTSQHGFLHYRVTPPINII